jgi:hypothetical protein
MKLRIVPARTGLDWVKGGIFVFRRQPLAMAALFFMSMAAMSLLSLFPLIGPALALALLPSVTLAMMVASAEAMQGRFPTPDVLLVAFRTGKERLRHMLQLGALYAVGFLLVIGLSALVDGGQFALVYLGRAELTEDIVQSSSFQARHVAVHGAVPAPVAAVLACARAGALARGATRQEPVLQSGGLRAQYGRFRGLWAGLAGVFALGGLVTSLLAGLPARWARSVASWWAGDGHGHHVVWLHRLHVPRLLRALGAAQKGLTMKNAPHPRPPGGPAEHD